MGYLISETTKEEREKIVAEALGNIDKSEKMTSERVLFLYHLNCKPIQVNRLTIWINKYKLITEIYKGVFCYEYD